MTETAPRPNAERAKETGSRLVEAAIAAFAEKGFHGTTTRDITAAAGTSPSALYVHHRSKEELLYLISRTGHERTLTLVREAIAVGGTVAQQLSRVIHDFAVHHAERHTESRIVNYELAALSPEHRADIGVIRRQIGAEVRGLVESGVASGEFDTPDPRMAAVALLSLGIDLGRWYRDKGPWKPEDIAERYADLALRIVGHRPV